MVFLLTVIVWSLVFTCILGVCLVIAGSIVDGLSQAKDNALLVGGKNLQYTNRVSVGTAMVNAYVTGNTEQGPVLVLLSGSGTPSPIYDFQALVERLRLKHPLVVMERLGYGFSDHTQLSRDVNTVLEQDRSVLASLGYLGPYILVAHSMAGLEALHWSQQYPEEVVGIIGLDMACPEAYSRINIPPRWVTTCAAALRRCGVLRLFPSLVSHQLDAVKAGALTDNDKASYLALCYRNFMSSDVRNEIAFARQNASYIDSIGLPRVKLRLFVSNGKGTGLPKEDWRQFQSNLLKKTGNNSSSMTIFNVPHYIHDYETVQIAQHIDETVSHWRQGI